MDSGQSYKADELDNQEIQDHISENLINNNEEHPKPSENPEVTESGADIMKKINEEAEKLEPIINKNDIKVFSKYEDLSEEELKKLLEEKTENLVKLNTQKEQSKNNLSILLNQINKTITDNYELLYKENPDPDILFQLHKEAEYKKKEFQISKKMNTSIKKQYSSINNKMTKNPDNPGTVEEDAILLNNLKLENKKLKISITKYKSNLALSNKEEKNEHKTSDFPNIVKMKSDEIRNLTMQKHEYYNKIKASVKSLMNVKNEIEHLEKILKKQEEKEKNEKLKNKIYFWINLIRGDLGEITDDDITKIIKNESNFIKELNKIEARNRNSNINNNKIQIHSIEEINNNSDEKNSNMSFRETNIPYINSSNMTRKSVEEPKTLHKGIFSKFTSLKKRQNSPLLNRNQQNNPINNYEEVKLNQYKETHESDNLSMNKDGIIQQEYEETTEKDFRELLDKKKQYLETNTRLEKNINEIRRTKKSKLLNVYSTVQQNIKRMEELKEQNNLLENEIMGLQKLFLLTIDKEQLKMEIKQKNKKNKLDNIRNKYKDNLTVKPDSSLTTENNLLNELKESNDSNKMKNMIKEKKKSKNKNKSGYIDDSPEKESNETREQKLEKIRKKYLYENPDEEINELNTNEEQTKEVNVNKDNLISDNNINNEENINDVQKENENEDKVN